MSLVLTRVDDRLIHGQVVVGWGRVLSPDRFVLADDTITGETWEHPIYRSGVPARAEVEFLSVDEAGKRVPEWIASTERVVVLVADVDAAVRLCEHAPAIEAINLGGFHLADGRRLRLPYLYLSDEELANLQALEDRGVHVTAQDLPTTAPVTLEQLRS